MERKLFYVLNFALLAVFAAAYVMDFTPEWKTYQKNYYKMSKSRSGLEIKQIIAKDLGRVDRCITCHVGMDEYTNPTMANDFTEHPYKAHPKMDLIGKNHPFTKYGCTICHQGQGLATTVKDAHGKVHNWSKPMLEGKMVQASCARCHNGFDRLKGAEFVAKGASLFQKHGCQGCHNINGAGQIVSVDLGEIADKPLERIAGYNFARIMKDGKPLDPHDWTLENWILGHLTNDPMEVVPNDPLAEFNKEPVAPSGMQDFRAELGQEGAEAITTYLLSMTRESLPNKYFVHSSPTPEPKYSDPLKNGRHVFEKYGCQGCHGLNAVKGRRNFNALGPGQSDPKTDMGKGVEPTLPDVVGTYTHEELVKKIYKGVAASEINKFSPSGPVPPLYMPSWKDKIKGKDMEDLATWLLSIAKKDESGF